MDDRAKLIANLKRTFSSIIPDKDPMESDRIKFLSSSILPLDWALGGGFPRGHITHIWGPDGGGKTTTMIPVVVSAQENPVINGLTLYIANEPKIDEMMFYRFGVDPNKIIFAKTRDAKNPLDGNKAMNMIREALGEVELIVVDSVAGLSPGIIYDMSSEDYSIGKVAHLLSDQLPLIANILAATDTAMIMLNQERASFEKYGMDTKPFAGYALAHWVSIRARIRSHGYVKEGKTTVGFRPWITIEKNDFSAPRKDAEWIMRFETGVDKVDALFTFAKEIGVISYSNGWKLGDISLNYPDGKNEEDARSRVSAEPDLQDLISAVAIPER